MKLSNTLTKNTNQLLIFLVVIFVVLYGVYEVLRIKQITINGVNEQNAIELRIILESQFIGKNVLTTNRQKVSNLLGEYIPEIKLIEVERQYPNGISIFVQSRESVFVIGTDDGKYYVDEEKYVLERSKSAQERDINIYYNGKIKEGEFIKDEALLSGLRYSNLGYKVIVKNERVTIIADTIDRVFLPLIKDETEFERVSLLLQKIIQKYTIEGKDIESVDLRYSDPIVKYR